MAKLTREENATVLAALRYYVEAGLGEPNNRPIAIHNIATDGDRLISLNAEGIDKLCMKLNARRVEVKEKNLRIYDNGGETADRYSVYYMPGYFGSDPERFQYVVMSEDPGSVNGVCQHGETDVKPRKRNGEKRIKFADLPKACRKFVEREYAELWSQ